MGTMMEFVQQLGDSMPGGFFIYRADKEEKVLYFNDAVLDIFGCDTREEFERLTGNTFQGMVYQEDLNEVQEAIKKQVAENEKHLDYVEYRILCKDGSVRRVDDYGKLVHTDDYGDVFFVFIRDITELAMTREESQRRADVIAGLSIDFTAIYLLDLDKGEMIPYRVQSARYHELVGEIKKTDWRKVLPEYAKKYILPEDRELYLREIEEKRIRERLQNEASYTIHYRCVGEGGGITYLDMSIVRIKSDMLSHHAVMGYRDVTEPTLRIQNELADRLNIEMELEREKRANEIKSAFLFNISHDIRTPMNAIKGFTDLAKRHMDKPERLRDYLGKVEESNNHLLTLIDDLLEMSRLDYGRIEIKEEIHDIEKEMNAILDLFRAQAEEKKITIIEEFALDNQNVFMDISRFERIIGNIMSNAVKFTPEHGTIRVTARKKHVSDSGYARFEFVISDNGIGMTEEFMQHMYEAFEREENSTKTGYIGTGLGLSIAKQLLDILGGSIDVKSKKGQGSTFTVNLPMKLADGKDRARKETRQEGRARKSGEYRVLLVEDIEINRMLAETLLEEEGFIVESVMDGSDAVEAIRNNPMGYYDLILMDIQMPVMNGYEATRMIRAMGREDTDIMPIIALSANARDEDKRMSMESGMNSHVAKPFDIANLVQVINGHLEKKR